MQVVTRLLLSGSPFFYWLCAVMTSTGPDSRRWMGAEPIKVLGQSSHILGDLIHCFVFSFNVFGFMFFVNRYPWT